MADKEDKKEKVINISIYDLLIKDIKIKAGENVKNVVSRPAFRLSE